MTHKWVGEKEVTIHDDAEEDYEEDDEDRYYDNKKFEKRTCDIVVESSEESNEAAVVVDEEEVIIDSSDEEDKTVEIKDLNFSWAPRSASKKSIDEEEIDRMVAEEDVDAASTTVNVNDEDIFIEDEPVSDGNNRPLADDIVEDSPVSKDSPIEILDSPIEEDAKLVFSPDKDDDVIEIEDDDDKVIEPEYVEPSSHEPQLLFSTMFSNSQSSVEEEILEPVVDDVKSDVVEENIFIPSEAEEEDDGKATARVDDIAAKISVEDIREEDPMRDLLDNVSTTATRASSIAGSLFDADSRSVIGESTGPIRGQAESAQPIRSKTFSFSEPSPSEQDTAGVVEDSGVRFSFSQPLDTSQASAEPVDTKTDETKDTTDDEDESSDEDDAGAGGLNFSWTAIPANTQDVNLSQMVDEEMTQVRFSAPIVEAEEDVEEAMNDSQFDFNAPNDESMLSDTETAPEADNEASDAVDKQAEALQSVLEENASSQEKTPEVEQVSTSPLRRSSRNAREEELSRMDTLPEDYTSGSITAPRLSTVETLNKIVEDQLGELETIDEERSVEEGSSLSRLSTEPASKPATPTSSVKKRGSKKSSAVEEEPSKESTNESSVSSVPAHVLTNETSAETRTPATPVRRSRRLSGATPVLTPVLAPRSRRISGALNKTSADTPTIPENEPLELVTMVDVVDKVDEKSSGRGRGKSRLESPDISTTLLTRAENQTPVRRSSRSSRSSKTVVEPEPVKESPKPDTPRRVSRSSKASVSSVDTPKSETPKKGRPRKTSATESPTPKRAGRSGSSAAAEEEQSAASSSKLSAEESAEKKTPRKSGRKKKEDVSTPSSPASALPKHMTPLKQAATPATDEVKTTPTRRTRRVSSGDVGSTESSTTGNNFTLQI